MRSHSSFPFFHSDHHRNIIILISLFFLQTYTPLYKIYTQEREREREREAERETQRERERPQYTHIHTHPVYPLTVGQQSTQRKETERESSKDIGVSCLSCSFVVFFVVCIYISILYILRLDRGMTWQTTHHQRQEQQQEQQQQRPRRRFIFFVVVVLAIALFVSATRTTTTIATTTTTTTPLLQHHHQQQQPQGGNKMTRSGVGMATQTIRWSRRCRTPMSLSSSSSSSSCPWVSSFCHCCYGSLNDVPQQSNIRFLYSSSLSSLSLLSSSSISSSSTTSFSWSCQQGERPRQTRKRKRRIGWFPQWLVFVEALDLTRTRTTRWTLPKTTSSLLLAMNDRTKNSHVLDRLANNPWTTTTRTTRTNRVVGMETPQRLYSSSSSTMDDKKRHYHHEEEDVVESSRPYRIVFLGTPEVAATTLQTLYDASLESQQKQQKQQQEQQQKQQQEQEEQQESLSSSSKPVPQQPVPPKFFFASYEQQETRTTPSSSLLLESKKVPNKQSLSSSFEIVAVVTQPPKRRRKKGHAMEQSPVGKLAQLLHLPLYTPEKIPKSYDQDKDDPTMFLQELTNVLKPDLCITAAYGQYLSKLFLSIPTFGTINIHPSLLPRWRGASPIQRSLQYGDNPIGVTILYTITKTDAGPIVAQKEYHLTQNQVETSTRTTLLPLLFELGTQLLLQQLPNIWSQQMTFHTAKPQVDVDDEAAAGVTLAPLIQHSNQKSEGELDLTKQTARQCHNLWRGFYEWPGVYLWIQIGGVDPAMTMTTTTTTTSSSSSSTTTTTTTTTTDPKEEEEDKDQELTLMESTRSNNDSSTTTRSSSTATVGTQPHRILKVKITETRVISESPTTKKDKHDNNDDDDKEDKQEEDQQQQQQQQQQYRIRLGPTRKDGLYVTCFDGSILELVMVQPPTKRSFPGRDLQNGYPNQSLYWLSPTMARQQQQQQQQQKLPKNELLIINNKETTTKEQKQQQQNDDNDSNDNDKKDNQKSKKNKKKKNKNTRTK